MPWFLLLLQSSFLMFPCWFEGQSLNPSCLFFLGLEQMEGFGKQGFVRCSQARFVYLYILVICGSMLFFGPNFCEKNPPFEAIKHLVEMLECLALVSQALPGKNSSIRSCWSASCFRKVSFLLSLQLGTEPKLLRTVSLNVLGYTLKQQRQLG